VANRGISNLGRHHEARSSDYGLPGLAQFV
jgi:hypothetical protein